MEKKHLFSSTGVPMAPPLSRPLLLLWSSPLLLLLLFGRPAAAASDPFWHSCNDTGNYTTKSSFAADLALLLTSLLSDAPATGFSNTTRGNLPPDQVYGRALCRGDVDPADCRACLGEAVRDVPRLYPGKKNATVWYDSCTLRYSERWFFSLFDGFDYWWDGGEVPEPTLFNRSLAALMRGLARRAAYDGSPSSSRMFALGEANYTSFSTIYGLAQCSEDLSPGECDRCLTEEINHIPPCCNGITGVGFMGSCFMRYELYRFYKGLCRGVALDCWYNRYNVASMITKLQLHRPSCTSRRDKSTHHQLRSSDMFSTAALDDVPPLLPSLNAPCILGI